VKQLRVWFCKRSGSLTRAASFNNFESVPRSLRASETLEPSLSLHQILTTRKVHQIFTKLLQLTDRQRPNFCQSLIRKLIPTTQLFDEKPNCASFPASSFTLFRSIVPRSQEHGDFVLLEIFLRTICYHLYFFDSMDKVALCIGKNQYIEQLTCTIRGDWHDEYNELTIQVVFTGDTLPHFVAITSLGSCDF
jgi:hypothetical protein